MKPNNLKNFPLIKLPQETEWVLFLIQEELKSRTLTNRFNAMGFDGSICSSDFSDLIFSMLGLENQSDDFYGWYLEQLDGFCEKVDLTRRETLTEGALVLYTVLVSQQSLS